MSVGRGVWASLRYARNLGQIRNYCYKSVRRPSKNVKPNVNTNAASSVAGAAAAAAADPSANRKYDQGNLTRQIQQKILATGPITVAEYMREVLTNPLAGYYMHRDVFGCDGDFITSPEISQIFGELVAIWLICEWRKIGSPTPFQLVELGPGRGTLARDVLKVLTQFKLGGKFTMHMVEVSPHLSQLQGQLLCHQQQQVDDPDAPHYQMGETVGGTKLFWHKRLEDVPPAFSMVLAHEFFDALPVHKLQRDGDVWKEILLDVHADGNKSEGDGNDFRFVISKAPTPISKVFQPVDGESRQSLEFSLESDRLISLLAQRLESDGGIALIMDYGHFGEKSDTFRAFRKHQLFDPLKAPGSADLTADVDFRQIKRVAERDGGIICYGPVEQGAFLQRMEGEARLQRLLENALPENKQRIQSGYEMLTSPQQMGARFKFFSMFPAVLKEHLQKFPINGFS